MIYVIATLNTKPGQAMEVRRAALPLISATLAETGCISYDLNADIGDENRLVFVERWEGREHLEAHFATAHIAAFGAAVKDLLEGQNVEIIEPKNVEVN